MASAMQSALSGMGSLGHISKLEESMYKQNEVNNRPAIWQQVVCIP
jgi:hypothetical protein